MAWAAWHEPVVPRLSRDRHAMCLNLPVRPGPVDTSDPLLVGAAQITEYHHSVLKVWTLAGFEHRKTSHVLSVMSPLTASLAQAPHSGASVT
jgi:hypothetical protein